MQSWMIGRGCNSCCMDILEPFALWLQFVYCGPGSLTVLPRFHTVPSCYLQNCPFPMELIWCINSHGNYGEFSRFVGNINILMRKYYTYSEIKNM